VDTSSTGSAYGVGSDRFIKPNQHPLNRLVSALNLEPIRQSIPRFNPTMHFMKIPVSIVCFLLLPFALRAQTLYFPPTSPAATWDTVSPVALGWCTDAVDELYSYLEAEDTKGFIVLKDGKIALEQYFGSFARDSFWYWASAGKTLTAFLVGKAQEENNLSLGAPTADYLGDGWSGCSPDQEGRITVWHQLTMTTGLDDRIPDNDCTIDSCLLYLADPGTRWAYHNAPYTLLERVLSAATGNTLNSYTNSRLKTKTGMRGLWLPIGFNNVYFSDVRSMARFGLLIQNGCVWQSDTLLSDTAYVRQMTNTSQTLNRAYGYLWWLNGKSSFMLPTSQFVFPGALLPAAPADMVAALGRDGQILSVAPSSGLVVVRMGAAADNNPVPTQLCNGIWQRLNAVICSSTAVEGPDMPRITLSVFPNPAHTSIRIDYPESPHTLIRITDASGKVVLQAVNQRDIRIEALPPGLYTVTAIQADKQTTARLVKR